MAFVFAFVFALPASAAGPWTGFSVQGQPYFAHASERDAFVKNDPSELDLYTGTKDAKPAAKLVRQRGMVTLQAGRGVQPKMADDALGAATSAPVLPPPQPVKPAPKASAQATDPDIDAILAVKGASLQGPERQKLYDELAVIKASDPAAFQRLKDAAGDPAKKAALGGLLDMIAPIPDDGDRLTYLRGNIGQLGGGDSGPGRGGNGNVVAPAPNVQGQDTAATGDEGFNKLVQAVVNAQPKEARDEAVKAILDFLVDDSNKFFVEKLRADKKQMAGFRASLAKGITDKLGDAETSNEVGLIYVALQTGQQAQAPTWVPEAARPKITQILQAYAGAKEIFLDKMKRWSEGAQEKIGEVQVGPWAGGSSGPGETSEQNTKIDAWEAALLQDAAKQAAASLNSDKINKDAARRVAGTLESGWNNPPGTVPINTGAGAGQGLSLNFTAADFSTQEIYRGGAVVKQFNMELPETPPRQITVDVAFKLKFRQQNGVMVPMLDIVDVSNDKDGANGQKAHIYGQAFDLQAISPTPGDLRLQNDPNSYFDKDRYPIKYQLSRAPNGDISFGVSDHMEKITASELYGAYTDQVMHNAHSVMVAGRQFQVLCQGGKTLQYAFFEVKDGQVLKPDQMQPSLLSAAIKTTNFDPTTHLPSESQMTSADLPLGYIGNKPDGTQQYYGLKWNTSAHYYDIVPEDKEIPDPNAATPAPAPATTTPVTSTGTPTDQTPAPTTPTDQTGTTPTTPTTPGNGTDRPTGSTNAADCKSRNAFDRAGAPSDYANKYHYWTSPLQNGSAYFCVFGDKYVHAGGVLSKMEERDGELQITMVSLSRGMTAGITRLDVSKIVNGHVTATLAQGGTADLDVDGVWVYHLESSKIASKPIDPDGHPIEASNAAWFQEKFLASDPGKRDSLRVVFDVDAKARAAKLVDIMSHWHTDQTSIFGDDQGKDSRGKLKRFLDIQIDKETGNVDPSNPPSADPIILNLTEGTRQNGGDVVTYNNRQHSPLALRWVAPMNGGTGFLQEPSK